MRVRLAECASSTVATTALLSLGLITSANFESLFDKLPRFFAVDLVLVRVVILDGLTDIHRVHMVLIVALTPRSIGHLVPVGVILIDRHIKSRPLALIAVAAEFIDLLELVLSLLKSSFGCACPISGWKASSRTGNIATGENTLRGGEKVDEKILRVDDEESGVDGQTVRVDNL